MLSANSVKIQGKVYNLKVNNFGKGTLSTFGLSVWNGKNKETGKNDYQFINCKYWQPLETSDGVEYIVDGKLAFDTWEKDGKKNVRPYILADRITAVNSDGVENTHTENKIEEELDDDLPF